MFALDSAIRGELRTPPEQALAELARAQHGVVARSQLRALGFSDDQVDRRMQRGLLHPLYRAVYAVGHRAISRKSIWMASVLACGPEATLSHRDAAALWAMRDTNRTSTDVTVATRGHSRKGITLHTARLHAGDKTARHNIPTTTPERTLLDLASIASLDAVVRALEKAERQRLIDMRRLEHTLERANGHRGVGRVRAALTAFDPRTLRTKSDLERAFLRLCRQAKIEPPTLNTVIEGFEVDAVWHEAKLIVELDAYSTHGDRRTFERDRERDGILLEAGYRTLRITGLRLEREPQAVIGVVKRLRASTSR